jgi:hypothetical protein
MGKRESMAQKVFSSIGNIVSTVENIHGDIAEKKGGKNEKELHHEEKRKKVYGLIKSINGRVENLVLDFFK